MTRFLDASLMIYLSTNLCLTPNVMRKVYLPLQKNLGVISFKRNRPGVERVYINSLFLKSPSRRF